MGNRSSEASKPEKGADQVQSPPPEEGGDYDPADDDPTRANNTSPSTATSTPFSDTPDTVETKPQLEKISFLNQIEVGFAEAAAGGKPSSNEQGRSKKSSFDPRLIHLLEFFRELYVRKTDLFRKVVPIRREELVELLKKLGKKSREGIEHPVNVQPFQRSYSIGASRGIDFGHRNDLKLEKFKFKTLNLGEVPGGDDGDVGTKPAGGGGGGDGCK